MTFRPMFAVLVTGLALSGMTSCTEEEPGNISGSGAGDGGDAGPNVDGGGGDSGSGPCGNGVMDPGEACDDGDGNSDEAPNACRTDCQSARCGDGVIDSEHNETCDNGAENADDEPDACRADCQSARCGDGVVDPGRGERCDEGADNTDDRPDGCRTDCQAAHCGDGVVDPGREEICDEGEANSDDAPNACRTTCLTAHCGDGVIDDGERCDDGEGNANETPDACRKNCEPARCGDGVTDSGQGERCDNGEDNNDVTPGACRTSCQPASCGDGVIDPHEDPDLGEICDNGTENSDESPNACRTTCRPAGCGDSVVDDNETCDDGEDNSDERPDACRMNCVGAHCGDAVIDEGELCDEGDANSDQVADACRADCTPAWCGDGVIDPLRGEVCDDGPDNSDNRPNACRTDCTPPSCGDGVIDHNRGETCDDGADNADDRPNACRTDCWVPHCGDGVRDAGETCDRGDANSNEIANACRTDCRAAHCGDGVIDRAELCDDGDQNSNEIANACRSDCRRSRCGDGVTDSGEACDDGAANDDERSNACRTDCRRHRCGDGVVDRGEICDNGEANSNLLANACRLDCTPARCGDGVVDEAEFCDDGAENSDVRPNACRTYCLPADCGDDVVDDGELCDEGLESSDEIPNTCRTTCLPAGCGDDVIDDGEICDNGLRNADDVPNACRTTCEPATCGDGVIDDGEMCDDAFGNSDVAPNACRTACEMPACGDAVIDDGEMCDDGPDNGDDAGARCRSNCTLASCGDGVMDAGEQCDNGDNNSDVIPNACRRTCQTAFCGDGVRDRGEDCDRGVNNSDIDPDACRTDCRLPRCGDGAADTDEDCDDGIENSDIVPDACRLECISPSCGDSIVDSGEACDNAFLNSDDLPNACRTDCQTAHCGDGVVDNGEQCDEGIDNDDDAPNGCRTDCRPAYCGDGVVDDEEICDDGEDNSDVDADACRADCRPPGCGDGVTDTDEQCDQADANSDVEPDTCRVACVLPACGDGVIDSGEACDDGPLNADDVPDACRTHCALSSCGDGVLDRGEACDAGEENSDVLPDACRTTCRIAACGDGVIDALEMCDLGADNRDDLPDTCRSNCVLPACGDGTTDDGEGCDDGASNSDEVPHACRVNCQPAHCGDGVLDPDIGEICDSGERNDDRRPNACRTTCLAAYCGDGVLDGGELCDDGELNSDETVNACRLDCTPARCGDGVIDPGEVCDDGEENSALGADACRTTCMPARCGDGVVDTGEKCDDGANNSDDKADHCRVNCQSPECGDRVVDFGEDCDDGNLNSDARPNACRGDCSAPRCGDGVIDPALGEGCDDGDNIGDDLCTADCRIPAGFCGDGIVNQGDGDGDGDGDGEGEGLRNEECDDGDLNRDDQADACRVDCRLPRCGDGVVDPGYDEICDEGEGNADDRADACRTTCRPARCGDGVIDAQEACDNGADNSDQLPDACRTSCERAHCGDGMIDALESCDDGNSEPGDGCDDACQREAGECGDGAVNDNEECDDGDRNSDLEPNRCRTDCRAPYCGDRVIDAGEGCDDANENDLDGCLPNCTVPGGLCGDGVLNVLEDCDDGNVIDGDGCNGQCAIELGNLCDLAIDVADVGTFDAVTRTWSVDLNLNDFADNVPSPCTDALGGRDAFFRYAATTRVDLKIATGPSDNPIDTVLSVHGACDDGFAALACDDDSAGDLTSKISLPSTAPWSPLVFTVHGFNETVVGLVRLTIQERAIRELDESCDPAREVSRCDAGLICVAEGMGSGTCLLGSPPTLTAVEALRLAPDQIRLLIDGSDLDRDAAGATLTYLDVDGEPIDLDVDSEGIQAGLTAAFAEPPQLADDLFSGRIELVGAPADAISLRISAVDSQDLQSEPQVYEIVAIPTRGGDEPCDVDALRDRCALGRLCVDAGGDGATCLTDPGFNCADAISFDALGTPDGRALRVDQSTERGNPDERGSCGGDGPSRVFEYTVEARSDLRIYTGVLDTDIDPVIYATLGCGGEALGCDDDSGPVGNADLVLIDVPAETTLVVVVDGKTEIDAGPFSLRVEATPIRALGEACDRQGIENRCDVDQSCTSVQDRAPECARGERPILAQATAVRLDDRNLRVVAAGGDPNGDAQVLKVTLMGAGDVPLDRNGDGEPDTVALDPLTFEWTEAAFEAAGDARIENTAEIESVRLVIVDSIGLASDVLTTPVIDLPLRQEGEPCDPTRRVDRCTPGWHCAAGIEGETCERLTGFDCEMPIELPAASWATGCNFHTFTYAPEGPVGDLYVAGSFNEWTPDPARHRMVDPDGDGTFTLALALGWGSHPYRFVQGDNVFLDPANPEVLLDEEDAPASGITIPPCREPIRMRLQARNDDFAGIDTGACHGEGREVHHRFVMPMDGQLQVDTNGLLPVPVDTVLRVRATCEDPASERACNDDGGDGTRSLLALGRIAAGTELDIIVDAYDMDSVGDYVLNLTTWPVLAEDASCTPDGQLRCADGLRCVDEICTTLASPTIVGATALLVDGDVLRVLVEGSDIDGDIQSMVITPLDGVGAPIDRDDNDEPDTLIQSLEHQFGRVFFDAHAEIAGFAETGVASVEIVLVDRWDMESEPVSVPVMPLPIMPIGEACDPDGLVNVCTRGLVCEPDPSSGPDAAVCTNLPGFECANPIDLNAVGVRDADALIWRYSGRTTHFLNQHNTTCLGGEGPEAVLVFVPPIEGALVVSTRDPATKIDTVLHVRTDCGDAETELACNDNASEEEATRSEAQTDIVAAEQPVYVFVDTFADLPANRGEYALSIEIVPVVGVGVACDLAQREVICGEGLGCVDVPGLGMSICALGDPPVATQVDAFRVDGETLRLVVSGHDPDGDALGIQIALLDAQGDKIPIDGAPDNILERPFDPPVTEQVEFLAIVDLPPPVGAEGVEARVVLFDETELIAVPVTVPIVDLPVLADGLACDPEARLNRCGETSACLPNGEAAPWLCKPIPGYDCNVVVDVNALGERVEYTTSYVGASIHNIHTTRGSCGGNGLDVVHRYLPSRAADVKITTVDDRTDFDTVMFVRNACGDPGTEIGCNDDVPNAQFRSALEFTSVPPQPLFIYVDGYDGNNVGSYALVITERPILGVHESCDPAGLVTRCHPALTCFDGFGEEHSGNPICLATLPSIANEVKALVTPENVLRVFVTGIDYEGDAIAVEATLVDADGQLVDVDGDGNPDRFRGDLDPLPADLVEFNSVAHIDGADLGVDFSQYTTVSVEIIDAGENHSQPMQGPVEALPIQVLGELCDGAGLNDRCDYGLACVFRGAAYICQSIVGYDCNQRLNLNHAANVGENGGFVYTGDSVFNDHLTEGSCGGVGPEVVHRFAMPERGKVVMTIMRAESEYDLGMYVRAQCAIPDNETICDSAGSVTRNARVNLDDLPAGTELSIFVDALEPEVRGTYTLSLKILPIRGPGEICDPTGLGDTCAGELVCYIDEELGRATCITANSPDVTSVEAYIHPDTAQAHLLITGEDVDANVDGVRVQGYNAAGEPVSMYRAPDDPEAPDGGAPLADGGAALADGGAALADGGAPLADGGDPLADGGAAQSDGGAAQPDAGAAQPDAGAAQPDAGAAQPDASAAQPDASAAQPDASAAQPDASAAQPDASAAQPEALYVAKSSPDSKVAPLGRYYQFDRTVNLLPVFFERVSLGEIVNPDVVSFSVVLLDATALRSEVVMVPLETLPIAGPGQQCDPTGFRAGCETGMSCATTDEGSVCASLGGFRCEDPININESAVMIDGDWVYVDTNAGREAISAGSCRRERSGPDVFFSFTVPEEGRVTATTLSPETTYDTVLYVRSVCDDPTSELMCSDDMEDQFGPSQTITDVMPGDQLYYVLDAFYASGTQSVGWYGFTVSMYAIRKEKQPCDPTGERSACVGGLACLENDEGITTCQEHFPPSINGVEVYRVSDDTLRVIVDGVDAGGNVKAVTVIVFDGVGGSFVLDGPFNDNLRGQAAFVAPADIGGLQGRGAAFVEVRIVDGMDAQSLPVIADVSEFPRPERSEDCDPTGLRDRCVANHVCAEGRRDMWACEPIKGMLCDAPVSLLEFAARDGNTWLYLGDTTQGGNTLDSSCGSLGEGQEVFHSFMLFTDARVTATTEVPETTLDSVLYVFETCDGEELACSDDTETALASTVDLGTITARTDLSIVVDSIGEPGPYGLRVTIEPDPDWPPLGINEIYFDESGADGDEQFTEIFGPPGTVLDGWVLVGVTLGTNMVPLMDDYRTIPLDGGVIPESGLFVVAVNENIGGPVDLVADVDWDNGPDAVHLRDPLGRVIDAVQYDERGDAIAGEGLPVSGGRSGRSIARDANRTDTNDNVRDFTSDMPTPGTDTPAAEE